MNDHFKKVNRKVQEEPQAETSSQPPTPGGREKVTQINVCIANTSNQIHHFVDSQSGISYLSNC